MSVRTRLGVFGYRDFALYWSGGLLSNVGTWLQNISASVFIYILTGSPLMVGLLNFAGFLPIMLFSLFGGVVSDRFDRRRVIVVTHAFSMAIAFVVAGLAFAELIQPWILIVGAFISNTSYAFAKPSLMSLLPHLVPRARLAEATGLNLLQFTGGQLGGSVLAAVILATLGPAWAFLVNGFTFMGPAVAVVLLANVPLPSPDARRVSGVAAVAAGIRYVRTSQVLFASLIGIAATSALAEALRTLSPVLATEAFLRPESDAGIIVATWGVGSAVAILSVGPLSRRFSPWRLAGAGALLHAGSAVGIVLAPGYAAGLAAAVALGIGYSLAFTVLTARLQDESSDAYRGRVMSLHTLSHLGMRPFTAFAAGALASAVGVHATFLVFGVVAASAFLLAGVARAATTSSAGDTATNSTGETGTFASPPGSNPPGSPGAATEV